MISDTIKKKITDAMKTKDEVRVSTLRMLSSALNYERIALQRDLVGEDEIKVVKREANKRKDAIEAFQQAQGKLTSSDQKSLDEKLEREKEELAILLKYLPEQLSDDELGKMIDEAISLTSAVSMKDMGKVIGKVMDLVQSRADGGRVAGMVKNKLIK